MFVRHPDEIDIEVEPGDLVIGDARLLHAAHANQSEEERTCLTLWYHPRFMALPDPIKAAYTSCIDHAPIPDDTEGDVRQRLEALKPEYNGDAKPAPWGRVPGALLATS